MAVIRSTCYEIKSEHSARISSPKRVSLASGVFIFETRIFMFVNYHNLTAIRP